MRIGKDANNTAAAAELLADQDFRSDLERMIVAAAVPKDNRPALLTQGAQDVQRQNAERFLAHTKQVYFVEEERVRNSNSDVPELSCFKPETAEWTDAAQLKASLAKAKNYFNKVDSRWHKSGAHAVGMEAERQLLAGLSAEAREDSERLQGLTPAEVYVHVKRLLLCCSLERISLMICLTNDYP